MPKLDPSSDEFRAAGHRLIDWVADYLENIERYDVLSRVQPGDIEKQFPAGPSTRGRAYDELIAEFEKKIVPGITHWNHPAFFAYFSITGSQAGILAELLTAAINANGMVWRTSPSLTELETVTLRWLRDCLGLPNNLFGIINDTASINSFLALAAAREAAAPEVRLRGFIAAPPLRIYCSEHAHSSIEKGALALGFGIDGVVKVASDDAFRMRADALEQAIARDRKSGAVPCAISATLGTTSTASVDPLPEIAAIAEREKLWLHVDAAYAGPATIVPEYRWLWKGIERADSIVVNPHKWLFTPIDLSVLYTRHPATLRNAFSLAEVPAYLTLTDKAEVNYMDYGLQLGRRFRALKLWMVMEHYGIDRLRSVIRDQIGFAERLAAELQKRSDVELMAPQSFSVVVFRKKGSDEENAALIDRMNATGKLFVSHTKLKGKYCIRVAIGNGATEWRHVSQILDFL
ncbi:MAG TPA: pyridoxal-dependent decarboxylase [Thermoanaerobaculia bacterium]|jgi:aromatic-L-amino-acid decarboxylase